MPKMAKNAAVTLRPNGRKPQARLFSKNRKNTGNIMAVVILRCETQQGTDQVLKIEHLLRG